MSEQKALNPTLLPDAFLSTFKPLLLIRHPALAYPSLYRATRAIMPHITIDSKGLWIEFSMAWMRMATQKDQVRGSFVCQRILLVGKRPGCGHGRHRTSSRFQDTSFKHFSRKHMWLWELCSF